MNGYITIKEPSKKWGVGKRRVTTLCQEGCIDGVEVRIIVGNPSRC